MTSPKNYPTNFLLFLLLFISTLGFGQTEIFNIPGGGTLPVGWSGVNNITSQPIDKSSYYLVQPGTPGDILTTVLYDLSGYSTATFEVDITSYGPGTHRSLKVEISTDGGSTFLQSYITPITTASYVTRSIAIPTVSANTIIRLSVDATSGRGIRMQNLILTALSSSPTITVGADITGLDYTIGSGPSAEQAVTVSGTNLTDNIVLTAPANFEISTTSGSGFGSAINLSPSSGTVSSTTIYTRLQSGLAINSYSGNITLTSAGATSQNIALSGDVIAAIVTCIDENFNSFTGTPPSGWSGSGLGRYTSATSSGVSPNSVQFNSTSDYLETPTLSSVPNTLSFWIKGNTTDAISALLVEGWNGSSWNTIENINPIPTTGTTKTYSSGLSTYGKFRFTYTKSWGNVAFDDVKVICDDPCSSGQTVTSFSPSTGPLNTEVTIIGTGFTGSTTVSLGGNLLSVNSQTATELKVTIPTGSKTGGFTVSEGFCDVVTSNFIVIDNDKTSCDGVVSTSELFISEVTDATTGSLTYIEIYNGTGVDIADLSAYSLRIKFNAGATTNTIALSGSVLNDDVFVVNIGLDATICSTVPGGDGLFADQTGSASGINFKVGESDCITLIKSGTPIDVWGNCADNTWGENLATFIGKKGVNFQRLSSAILPSLTFNEADWSIVDFADSPSCSENYNNVGSYSLSTLPNLISQSSKLPSCASSAVLYVIASEGYNEVGDTKELVYQWYEVAPGVANWTILADGGIYSGSTTETLTISNTASVDGYQYYCQIRENDATCYQASNSSIIINNTDFVTWNGSWSSIPTTDSVVTLDADYTTSVNGSFSCCSLIVNDNVTLDIDATFVSIENDLTINNAAVLNVETSASLIMVSNFGSVTLTGTGIVNVNKSSTPYERYDYTYWSSPIVDETIGDALSGSYANYIFSYNSANFNDVDGDGFDDDQNDWTRVGAAEMMSPGKGYAAMGAISGSFTPSPIQNATFSGEVNNGFIYETVTTNNSPNSTLSYNLIGNPYPSAMSADDFILINSAFGMGGTLYFWTHVDDISLSNPGPDAYNFHPDDYATYNLTGGVGTGGASPSGSNIPTGIIGSGQAFFIGVSNSSFPVIFSNSMRDKSYANTQFFRGAQNQIIPQEKDRIWLDLTNADGVFNQMLVGFIEGATTGYDRNYDGEYFGGGTFVSLYSMMGDTPYTIQGLPKFNISQKIAVGFIANIVGDFKLRIGQIEGVFNLTDVPIFLIDNETETVHNLKESDYDFTVTQTGTYNNRFEIVFQETQSTLVVDDVEINSNQLIISSESDTVLVQYLSDDLTKMTQLKVYDILGRILVDKKLDKNTTSIISNSFADGSLLIFKVQLDNGETLSKKFIKL